MGGQGMPIGHEEQTLVFGLKPNPVFEDAVVVAQMQGPGGPHAR